MALANNGILICAMFLAYGLVRGDKWMIAAAFAVAGLSYVANAMDEAEMPESNVVKIAAVSGGAAGYVWLVVNLLQGVL